MTAITARLESAASAKSLAPAELTTLAKDVFVACGVPDADAATAAEIAVYAQLRGSDSHGAIKARPAFKWSGNLAATNVLDADNGLGLIAGHRAIDVAIGLARQLGLGAVAVRNSSHYGVAGYYADRAAEQGLIGLSFSNAMPAMAPHGATEARLGTNPIAAAFPVPGEDTIVLDMATTTVARSRIRHAKSQGHPIPADWALDPEGRPTTDPDQAIKGTVQPGFDVTYENMVKRPSGISQFFLVMNPAGFAGSEPFGARAKHLAAGVRSAKPIAGSAAPRLPGARGHEVERRARSEGIQVTPILCSALQQTAKLVHGLV